MTENNNEKKKKHPYQMTFEELIKEHESVQADTPEAKAKREKMETDQTNAEKDVEDAQFNYIFRTRGEHTTHKGKPKSYMLSKKNTQKEASELIHAMALEGIRQELGEKGVELYKKNPSFIEKWVNSRGIDFYDLKDEIVKNRRKFWEGDLYKQFKERLPTIDEKVKQQTVHKEILRNPDHYDPLLDYTNKKIREKTGLSVKKGTKQDHVLSHLDTFNIAGKFNEEYKEDHRKTLKKYRDAA